MGEHLPCTQGVKGSNPLFSTINPIGIKVCTLKTEQRSNNNASQRDRDNEISECKDDIGYIYDFNREAKSDKRSLLTKVHT